MIEFPKDIESKHMIFLEDLRQSGQTNMFGAVPFIQLKFKIDETKSRDILLFWLDNYNELIESGIITRE